MNVTTNVHTYAHDQGIKLVRLLVVLDLKIVVCILMCKYVHMYVCSIHRKSYGYTYLAHALMFLKNRFRLYTYLHTLVYKYTLAKVQMCGHTYFCVLQYICKYIFTLICMNIFVIGKFIWGLLDIIYK